MSDYKIAGSCTVCDKPCFEIRAVWGPNERHPGEPKQLGEPLQGAVRIRFKLLDGTFSDLTFCEDCAELLTPSQYHDIWRKVMRSWQREMAFSENNTHDWYPEQFANGLLLEVSRTLWTEAWKNG